MECRTWLLHSRQPYNLIKYRLTPYILEFISPPYARRKSVGIFCSFRSIHHENVVLMFQFTVRQQYFEIPFLLHYRLLSYNWSSNVYVDSISPTMSEMNYQPLWSYCPSSVWDVRHCSTVSSTFSVLPKCSVFMSADIRKCKWKTKQSVIYVIPFQPRVGKSESLVP